MLISEKAHRLWGYPQGRKRPSGKTGNRCFQKAEKGGIFSPRKNIFFPKKRPKPEKTQKRKFGGRNHYHFLEGKRYTLGRAFLTRKMLTHFFIGRLPDEAVVVYLFFKQAFNSPPTVKVRWPPFAFCPISPFSKNEPREVNELKKELWYRRASWANKPGLPPPPGLRCWPPRPRGRRRPQQTERKQGNVSPTVWAAVLLFLRPGVPHKGGGSKTELTDVFSPSLSRLCEAVLLG